MDQQVARPTPMHGHYSFKPSPEFVARRFHDHYEELAPKFGYKTREASRVPFDQLPESNKQLMIAVAGRIISEFIQ